jgi:hypothetical protein
MSHHKVQKPKLIRVLKGLHWIEIKLKVLTFLYKTYELVISQVPMATSIEVAVFWDVSGCSLIEIGRRFKSPCCLHHQGEVFSDISRIL